MNDNRLWKIVAATAAVLAVIVALFLVINRDGGDSDVLVSNTVVTETTIEPTDTTLSTSTPTPTVPDEIPNTASTATIPKTPTTLSAPTSGTGGATQKLVTDQIDLTAGAAFGFAIGEPVDPDDVIPTVSAILGPLTHDTDWYTLPYQQDFCMTGVPTRVLWWGSFSMSFFNDPRDPQFLWTWSIGDRAASLAQRDTEPYAPPTDATSPLATSSGITVGSPEADVIAQFGDQYTVTTLDDGQRSYELMNGKYQSVVLVDNGVVTGIAASLVFC